MTDIVQEVVGTGEKEREAEGFAYGVEIVVTKEIREYPGGSHWSVKVESADKRASINHLNNLKADRKFETLVEQYNLKETTAPRVQG